jgi:hypothetical protein
MKRIYATIKLFYDVDVVLILSVFLIRCPFHLDKLPRVSAVDWSKLF